jgi:hypothetical protein
MIEIWKDIPDYEGLYQVSNLGQVRNNKNILKPQGCSKRNGKYRYLSIKLSKNGKAIRHRIHRLVAVTFLNYDINEKDLCVDHINNNSFDNNLDNLQIISIRENVSKDRKNIFSNLTGVSRSKIKSKPFRSRIVIDKKEIILGYYENEYDAHLAYEKALKELVNQ